MRVLRYHMVDGLTEDQLGKLLRRYRSEATLPRLCNHYGRGEKSCTKGDKCQDLHICKQYLFGTCKSDRCPRSHQLTEDQPKQVLTNYALDKLPISVVKLKLAEAFCTPKDAAKDADVAMSTAPEKEKASKKTK